MIFFINNEKIDKIYNLLLVDTVLLFIFLCYFILKLVIGAIYSYYQNK